MSSANNENQQASMPQQSFQYDGEASQLLVPHTIYNKKGDKMPHLFPLPSATSASIIPTEKPKHKKRKYHPELEDASNASLSHLKHPLPSQSSRHLRSAPYEQELQQADSVPWDDGVYVGVNNHPVFDISAVPVEESENTSKTKVSSSSALAC